MVSRAPSTILSLRVMGALDVLDARGARLDVPLRLRWLLARLALERRPLARSRLAQTFWRKGATQSLRQALYALKSLPDAARWLVVTRETVAVQLDCDALRFDELVEQRRFIEALDLGPLQLFDSATFERTDELSLWIEEQSERFAQRVRLALLGATRACAERGALDRALSYVDRGLALDPLDEPLAREGMQLCAAQGAVQAALDRYESLRRGLLSKLGVEPTEQTDQLADALARARRSSVAPSSPPRWSLDAHPSDRAHAYASARRWLGDETLAKLSAAQAPDSASALRAPLGEAALRWAVADALARRADGALVSLDAAHDTDPRSLAALLDAARHRAVTVVVRADPAALDPSARDELERAVAERVIAPVAPSRRAPTRRHEPRDAHEAPLSVLSRDARRVAQWLAIEPSSDDALLDAVLSLTAAEREASLAELEHAGLLAGRALRREEIAASARATTSESVALGWRRTAALTLEARGEHERASRHFLACGERARAVRGAIAGAERLCALFATDEARAGLDRVAEAVSSAVERFALASVRERIAAIDGEHDARARWALAMRSAAAELQRDEALVEAQLREVALLRERGLYAQALVESEACERECVRASLPSQALRARAERAMALFRTGATDAAERLFESLSRERDESAVAVGEYGLGAVRGYRLDLEGARVLHERVLTAARARGDLGVVVRALNGLAATAERAGQRRRAAERFDESAKIAARIRDHEGARMAEVNAALAWVFGGRPAKAMARLDAASPPARALLRPLALEAQARAELWLELGDLARARGHFDRCESLAATSHDRRRSAHARLDRAFCARTWERCLAEARAVLEREQEHTRDVAALSWLELALLAPDETAARAMIDRAGSALGPVASLLAMMARLRIGEDPGPALDQAIARSESSFSLLALRLAATRRAGDARAHAERQFDEAFAESAEGLDREHARRWRAWIDARAARALDAAWTTPLREAP